MQGTYININGDMTNFNYTNKLTSNQYLSFVIDFADMVTSKTPGCAYILEDAIFDYLIVKYFTDIALFEHGKDFNLDIFGRFLKDNSESVMRTVTNAISLPYFSELLSACEKAIDLRQKANSDYKNIMIVPT